jgi:hypothetical protein
MLENLRATSNLFFSTNSQIAAALSKAKKYPTTQNGHLAEAPDEALY